MLTYEQIEGLALPVRDAMADRIERGHSIAPHLLIFPDTDALPDAGPLYVDVTALQSSPEAKDQLWNVIQRVLAKPNVLLVIHVTEAWVRTLPRTDSEGMERAKRDGLSKDPQRAEALNLHIYTPECEWVCMSMIEREPNRVTRAVLTPLNVPGGFTGEGRFVRERRMAS